jgi:hypothetical protein
MTASATTGGRREGERQVREGLDDEPDPHHVPETDPSGGPAVAERPEDSADSRGSG